MWFNCRQIQDALISGDPRIDDAAILAHLEFCSYCQRTLELPDEISGEIGNINLLPASFDIYANVMATLLSEESTNRAHKNIKMARIGGVLTAYAGLALLVALYWSRIMTFANDLLGGFPRALDINLSDISLQFKAILNIARNLSQSPLLFVSALMSVTLVWAIVIDRLRDALKN